LSVRVFVFDPNLLLFLDDLLGAFKGAALWEILIFLPKVWDVLFYFFENTGTCGHSLAGSNE
jgi:hypothetical protein